MKRAALLAALLGLLSTATPSHAQIPGLVSFQGILTDNAGNLLPDGAYNLTFRLFPVDVGGAPIYAETQPGVGLSKGGFSVLIGSVVALGALAFDSQLWLEVQVGTDAPMAPRVKLGASPYALTARTVVDNAITSAKILNGTITDADVSPSAAIQATKISGDAGMDDDVSFAVIAASNTTTNAISTTVDCPAAGTVLLLFTGEAVFFGKGSVLSMMIATTPTGFDVVKKSMGFLDGAGTERTEFPFNVMGSVAVTAGPRTFYGNVLLEPVFDAVPVNTSGFRLTALFIPKGY